MTAFRMYSRAKPLIAMCIAAWMMTVPAHARSKAPQVKGAATSASDETFVALRDAARANDAQRTFDLAAKLPAEFDIPSYVEYFKLRVQIYDAGGAPREETPDAAIRAYLDRWQGEAIADRLRNDWLLALGKRRDTAQFDEQYPLFVLKDDPQLACYAQAFRGNKLLAGASEGLRNWAATEAKPLLEDPRNLGDGCLYLVEVLGNAKVLDDAQRWQMVRRAFAQNQIGAGRRVARFIQDADLAAIDQVAERGRLWLTRAQLAQPAQREIAALAIIRIARADPNNGASEFERIEGRFSSADRAWVWAQIGEFAARKVMPQAYDWFKRADAASADDRDDGSRAWQVRAALRQGDWAMVRDAIARMSPLERRDPAWVYWQARALSELQAKPEDAAEANRLYVSIATDYSFYGQLAIEALGGRILVPPQPEPPTAEELAPVERDPGLARALRLYALDLRYEGNREWNWRLRGADDRKLLAAAEYGRRMQAFDRAISSSERTRSEHDFALRYPTPFRASFARNASSAGLDEAWVYGLVRQESRFVVNARSGVGAAGLMQVMPTTARYVARKIGLSDFVPGAAEDLETNLTIGTRYLRMVLDDLDSSEVLASAAYNAGPSRARQWRASLARPVEGAVFAETIPFTETRDYVKKVLSNATYYAAMFERRAQSIRERLGSVAPRSASGNTELP